MQIVRFLKGEIYLQYRDDRHCNTRSSPVTTEMSKHNLFSRKGGHTEVWKTESYKTYHIIRVYFCGPHVPTQKQCYIGGMYYGNKEKKIETKKVPENS